MGTSDATQLARVVVADLAGADAATKRIGAVLVLLADEVDRLTSVVDRLSRTAR